MPNPTFNLKVDHKIKLPTLQGKGAVQIVEFVNDFNHVSKALEFTDKDKVSHFILRLYESPAKFWVQNYERSLSDIQRAALTFGQISTALINYHTGGSDLKIELEEALHSASQKPGQSSVEFIEYVVNIINQLDDTMGEPAQSSMDFEGFEKSSFKSISTNGMSIS